MPVPVQLGLSGSSCSLFCDLGRLDLTQALASQIVCSGQTTTMEGKVSYPTPRIRLFNYFSCLRCQDTPVCCMMHVYMIWPNAEVKIL